MAKTAHLLSRGVEKVLPSREGLEHLIGKRKIRLYQGFDPTGTRLHLGHAVGLRKLMEFAIAGHEVIFLFGTGTVLVGDPSLRETAREHISEAEIDRNIKDWQKQASKIVDFKKVTVKKNADWLTKLTLKDIIAIGSKISATQLFKRESFERRGNAVWYHETMYPLLQGYDSLQLDVDLELGGTDQEFNMLIGRELMKKIKHKEKYVLTTPILPGPDGQKMGKTAGNAIWLDDEATEMFGKLMSVHDDLMADYFELATEVSDEEIAVLKKELKTARNPRDLKARMAYEVTRIYHGDKAANKAAEAFNTQFKDKKLPQDAPPLKLNKKEWDLADLLIKGELVSSKSEARRVIAQGGVRINSQTVKSEQVNVTNGDIIQVGKRKFVQVK